jgi:hypothetical protein
MPNNPSRSTQGGDVEGTTTTDVGLGSSIAALSVAKASYDTGFPIGHVTDSDASDGDAITLAELKLGYTSYGRRKVGQ